MIAGFDQVEGFVGAAVVSTDGELVAADGRESEFDPSILGFFVASALDSVGRVASPSLGAVEVACFELDDGTVVARWVDDRRHHVVLMLLEPRASVESARYVLDATALSISRVIARWNDRGWASPLPNTTGQW
jgi:predicted regulator of Ras-like GTPase activity (Roadblock/LC7/MglB family)